jgi:DNA-binding transcriptional MocR family regulator
MVGNVDKDTAVPAHIQVRDFLLTQIKTGSLKPAEKIPSERELSKLCNVSRIYAFAAPISRQTRHPKTISPSPAMPVRRHMFLKG